MADWAVTVDNLNMKYQNKIALNDLSFTVGIGDIHALVGASEAGKTTLLNILAGTVRPTNGTGKIFDQKIGSLEARKMTGYVPAKPAFYPSMSLLDYLVYMGMLSGVSNLEAISRGIALLKRVDLYSFRDKKPKDLTPGMRTKIAIAQSLMSKPRLLLLDEPVTGLDQTGRIGILQIIREVSINDGVTIIISSSLWTEVEEIADKVTLLKEGKLLLNRKTSEIGDLYRQGIFSINTSANSLLMAVLKRMGYLRKIIRTEKDTLIVITDKIERFRKDLPGVVYKLEIELFAFQQEEINLESISRYLLASEGSR